MTWQAVGARVREIAAAIRSRVTFRLVRHIAIAITGLGFLSAGVEALLRAHIDDPFARAPTTLFTRPQPWGEGASGRPMVLGTVGQGMEEQRVVVGIAKVPQSVIEAVVAVEDQRFYQHHGLDVKRIGGALIANIRAGAIRQGGSTITQQLVRALFLSAERTPLRKFREAAMAIVLEARYTKEAILETYLNDVYLGQDGSRAIHGVGAAAEYYFGKPLAKVSLAESAQLAGMIQAPNRYHPIRHPRVARHRRNLVLSLMHDQHRIGAGTATDAARVRLGSRVYSAASIDGRFFRDFVLAGRGLPSQGVAVYTTLDAGLQVSAERAVRDGLARLRVRGAEAALVALDPRTGDILAMVGGRDYAGSQFNRAVDAHRQPGSAFKPLVALAALHRDEGGVPAFTLASRIEDEPLSIQTKAGRWEPSNYDGSFRGEVTVREAIEQSLNVPFARIGLTVGPQRIIATARRLGVTSPLQPVPSLALGSSEITLLELVRAYGVFATGGDLAATRVVFSKVSLGKPPVNEVAVQTARVVDPAEAYLVTSALEGVIARGTGRALGEGRFGAIAGKTGTSNDWRDAWFVSYSPSLVVGVWVGYDDGRSLGLTGADAALPIVAKFLDRTDPDARVSSFPVPEGIEMAQVAGGDQGWDSGCGREEVFLEGTVPDERCDRFETPRWDGEDEHGEDREDRISRGERFAVRLLARLLARHSEQPEK